MYTYATYQTALAQLMVVPNANVSDPNFVAILPSIIDYAEQRIYRELDVLAATLAQTVTATASKRFLSLAGLASLFVTVEDVNIITPVSQTVPDSGTRNQCRPVSKEYLDAVWNSATGATVPTEFAMITNESLILGPWPDQAYTVEIVGKIRPLPLYTPSQSEGTFLSLYLPDLFMAASMVFASGYQKNFGSQADNPQMAMSWETQYLKLYASANSEETRKKFHGWAMASSEPTPAPAT